MSPTKAWEAAKIQEHHESAVPLCWHGCNEPKFGGRPWICVWVWPWTSRNTLWSWNWHGKVPWHDFFSTVSYFFRFFGVFPVLTTTLNSPRLPQEFVPAALLRLCPQQFGCPTSRPREYRLTWNTKKRKWDHDPWQLSYKYFLFGDDGILTFLTFVQRMVP